MKVNIYSAEVHILPKHKQWDKWNLIVVKQEFNESFKEGPYLSQFRIKNLDTLAANKTG